jgi:hypothetical protein
MKKESLLEFLELLRATISKTRKYAITTLKSRSGDID